MDKLINNEQELDEALSRAFDLIQMDLEEDSKEYKELDSLATEIKKYEQNVYSLDR